MTRYLFKHILMRDAVYGMQLHSRLHELHRRAAEAIEELYAADATLLKPHYADLAYHYEQAGIKDKAIEYLLLAGDQARLGYTHQEAIDHYERALTILKEQGTHDQAARTLMKIGLTYHNAFASPESRRAYEEGFTLWQRAREGQPVSPLAPAPHPLRVELPDAPKTLDPAVASGTFSTDVITQLFSGLVTLTLDSGVVPDVAQSWELSENGRMYIFRLRDDVRWSDGVPVTAGDFEYAWKRILAPATKAPYATLLYDIKGARPFHQGEVSDPDCVQVYARDAVTLVVELEEQIGYFLYLLTQFVTYPVPRHIVETQTDTWAAAIPLVTNGPYRLEAWVPDKLMVFSRAPDYHGHREGNVERVELSISAQRGEALVKYEADHLDVFSFRDLSLDKVVKVRQRHAGEYTPFPELTVGYVQFDVSRPPFDDTRVRQAFSLAVDKEILADVILKGYALPATGGFVPVGMPGHTVGIGLAFDSDRARYLLAEAGYPGGRGFPSMDMPTVPGASGGTAQFKYLQAQWRENLGIDIPWKTLELAAFFNRIHADPPHLSYVLWVADYPDPDNFLRVALNWRETGWHNETFATLVDRARRMPDQNERTRSYRQADEILRREVPIIPLTYERSHLLVKPWVSSYPRSANKRWFWKDIVIEPHGKKT